MVIPDFHFNCRQRIHLAQRSTKTKFFQENASVFEDTRSPARLKAHAATQEEQRALAPHVPIVLDPPKDDCAIEHSFLQDAHEFFALLMQVLQHEIDTADQIAPGLAAPLLVMLEFQGTTSPNTCRGLPPRPLPPRGGEA